MPKIPPELASLLDLSPSETTPLLLELARRQTARRRPADVLKQLDSDRFVMPSFLDQRLAHQLDGLSLAAAHEFDAVLLSPVAPLGTCSVVAPSSQDRTLSTSRGSEVVSDPTNMLALLCARRLANDRNAQPRLCSVHEVLRAQPLPPRAGFSRHFRLFVLAEAGLGRAEDGFELDAITRHIQVFDRLMNAASALGARFPNRRLRVLASAERSTLADRLCARLAHELPHVTLARDGFTSNYYAGLRVLFSADNTAGEPIELGDTGVFDWLAKLTSDKRMRFVASGIGIQLFPALFREG